MKAIFFDIDGTLLDMKKGIMTIPKRVKTEIRRVQKLGHKVFIASGRPNAFIPKELLEFGFDGFVLCNGAHIKIADQEIKYPLEFNRLKRLIQELEQNHKEYILETSIYGHLNKDCHNLFAFYDTCNVNYDFISTEFDKDQALLDTMKLEVWINTNIDDIKDMIKNDFAYDCHGTGGTFEIYSNQISKATGILKVLDYLNIPVENSFAFGDGSNDIEMFHTVHTAIAMQDASEAVKKEADLVCASIEQDGIADMLIKLF